jgi:hypothetical protein
MSDSEEEELLREVVNILLTGVDTAPAPPVPVPIPIPIPVPAPVPIPIPIPILSPVRTPRSSSPARPSQSVQSTRTMASVLASAAPRQSPQKSPLARTPQQRPTTKLVNIVNPVRIVSFYKVNPCFNGQYCAHKSRCWFWHDASDRAMGPTHYVAEDKTNVCYGFVVHGVCSRQSKGLSCIYDHVRVRMPCVVDNEMRVSCAKTFAIS